MANTQPASRVEAFDVTIPAGTTAANPLEVATAWSPGELVGVEIVIPDGHNGLTGMRLLLAHAQAIPHTIGAWLIGNDDTLEYNILGLPNTGAWSVLGYNTDIFDHMFHVRYLVADFNYLPAATIGTPPTTPVLS